MFEKQLVTLNPKYITVLNGDEFSVSIDKSYVNLTEKYNLNIIAICGRNGSGKSTFLRMLAGRHNLEAEYVICWIDCNGEFACNKPVSIVFQGNLIALNEYVHDHKLSNLCGNTNTNNDVNNVHKNLLAVYSINPPIFDLHQRPLFDGFHLNSKTGITAIDELETTLSENIGIKQKDILGNFRDIIKKHPTFHALALIAQDSSFEGIIKKTFRKKQPSYNALFRLLRDKQSDALDSEINNLIYADGGESSFKGKLFSEKSDWVVYGISEYNEILGKLMDISKRVDDWIKQKIGALKNPTRPRRKTVHIWEHSLHQEIIELNPYMMRDGKMYHLSDLSDGEYSQVKLLFNLAAMIMPEYACWFYMDDIDDYLHPEWKRNLVDKITSTYLEFVTRISKSRGNNLYSQRMTTCIIATHSPFVLSDLSRHCVIHFTKSVTGKTDIHRSSTDTFAGNIGELFHTEFFMEATIGEFARKIIRNAINNLDNNPSKKSFQFARGLFENVGDEVLKNLLLEKLHNAENKFN